MVSKMLKDGDSREGEPGQDIDHQEVGLREGQKDFFLKSIRRDWRKRWARKTWSM